MNFVRPRSTSLGKKRSRSWKEVSRKTVKLAYPSILGNLFCLVTKRRELRKKKCVMTPDKKIKKARTVAGLMHCFPC